MEVFYTLYEHDNQMLFSSNDLYNSYDFILYTLYIFQRIDIL